MLDLVNRSRSQTLRYFLLYPLVKAELRPVFLGEEAPILSHWLFDIHTGVPLSTVTPKIMSLREFGAN
jgi:hypothetical protein